MHVLCSTLGSAGDVFPMLGLAIELQRRGHRVSFITSPYFQESVEQNGLAFYPIGTREDFLECVEDPDVWNPTRALPRLFQFLRRAIHAQYEVHEQFASDKGTTGITSTLGFGALMAQEKLRMPILSLHLQPAVLWSDKDPPRLPGTFGPRWLRNVLFRVGEKLFLRRVAAPVLNEARATIGLGPIRGRIDHAWSSPRGVICMFPEWYASVQPDWPKPIAQTAFPLWNDASEKPIDRALERFLQEGEPPLVFTPGSANSQAPDFFRAAVDACNQLNRRGVLLTKFPRQLPADLPASMFVCSYVPLEQLLAKSALFVHHGGIGSASQAMAAGIPQIIMPMAHDQFDNAHRLERMQIGFGIPRSRFHGENLANGIRRMLESNTVASACKEVQRRFSTSDPIQLTADAFERMVQ